MADDALKITGLCKSYGDFSLKDINLAVPEGTVVGLVGENGAGKTTTIKASLDLIKKDSGKISFFGKEMSDDPLGIRSDIGVVFDSLHFSYGLNIEKIEKICSAVYDNCDKKVFEE